MKNFIRSRNQLTNKPLVVCLTETFVVISVVFGLTANSQYVFADEIPSGFKQLDNGDVIVDDPTSAFAPAGYQITSNGVLIKINTTAASKALTNTASSEIMVVPPGYHRMSNGDVMANSPATAKAPAGYKLVEGGVLRRIDNTTEIGFVTKLDEENKVLVASTELTEIPPGFHRMSNGDIMANSVATAKAPPGYYIGPNGVLVAGEKPDGMSFGGGGMWMFEYMYMHMNMDGLLDTTNTVTPTQLFDSSGSYCRGGGCMMVPTEMIMKMHMFMGMYHTRDYMLMGMLNYLQNDMDMLSNDGVTSTMDTKGIGDTVLTAQFRGPMNVFFDFGMSIPTGSITERGPMTHNGTIGTEPDVPYPYGMQLGSGSYDYMQGLTYLSSSGDDKMHWGASYLYTGRIKDNDSGYKLGDELELKGWLDFKHTSMLSSRGIAELNSWGQIEGEDKNIASHRVNNTGPAGALLNMSPAMDANNYGGVRLDVGYRLKWENKKMTSFSGEFVLPIYQDLYGPQMETTWMLNLAFGAMF